MTMHTIKTLLAGLLLSFLASPVFAHTGAHLAQGFVDGFLHPLQCIDHLLVILAIGLWGFMLAGKMIWALPLTFLVMMAAGAGLYAVGFQLPIAEQGVQLSLLAFGLILGFNLKTSIFPALGMVAIIALCHGYVHASELTIGADKITYVLGFLLATAHLQGLGLVAGLQGGKTLNVLRVSLGLTCSTAFVVLLAG